jgi:hypothetical protein
VANLSDILSGAVTPIEDELSRKLVRKVRPEAWSLLETVPGAVSGGGGGGRRAPEQLELPLEQPKPLAETLSSATRPETRPYRHDWRGERTGEYDPRYFDIEEDVLPHHETGEIIARKDKLIAKPELQRELPGAQREEGTIYRGMSADEYENIQNTGLIQSKGEYNIGDQQRGLTYFGHRPEQAEFYAGAFAPPQNKPTFDKPAYVIAARKPPPEQLGNPDYLGGIESKDEIGVTGALPAEDIKKVYRGNVVRYAPPHEAPGWKEGASFDLHWEVIDFIKKYGIAAAVGAGLISQEMANQMQQGEGG